MKKICLLFVLALFAWTSSRPPLQAQTKPDTVWSLNLGWKYQVNEVKFSPDGQIIYVAQSNFVLRVGTLSGQIIDTLCHHSGVVNHISLSQTGIL